jgi:hypothetical protein
MLSCLVDDCRGHEKMITFVMNKVNICMWVVIGQFFSFFVHV